MTELDLYYNNATKLMLIHQPQAKVLNSGVPRHVPGVYVRADALCLGAPQTTLGRQLWDMCLELGFIALLIPIHLS